MVVFVFFPPLKSQLNHHFFFLNINTGFYRRLGSEKSGSSSFSSPFCPWRDLLTVCVLVPDIPREQQRHVYADTPPDAKLKSFR